MSINTTESYMIIGTGVNSDNSLVNALTLPAPVGATPFTPEFMAEAERNADATMILQQIGRTQYTTTIKLGKLKNKKWWQLNRWFETYGYVFYLKYFNHADGKVKIHRFYRGNMEQPTISTETEILQGIPVPKYYYNCGFTIIDMGETDIITVQEMAVT